MQKYDILIIGGGPAGMMAGIWAGRQGKKVCLVEQNSSLGQKLLLSGGGRCNFTNAQYDHNKLIEAYGKEGAFLHSAFAQFSPKETLEFFYNLGMGMKVEENNRVFPKSDRAQDLLGHLQKDLQKHKVEVLLNTKLIDLQKSGKKIEKAILESDGQKIEIKAEKYILAGGGKSYPKTGSNGSAHEILKKLGHKLGAIRPALTPINIKEKWIQNLQGISARDSKVKIFQNNQRKYEFEGDVLFTHFGLSGPAILDASRYIGELLEKGEVVLQIDVLPKIGLPVWEEMLKKEVIDNPNKNIVNILAQHMSLAIADEVLKLHNIDGQKKANAITHEERIKIGEIFKNIKLTPASLLGFEAAMVSVGGLDFNEIDQKTMKSKVIENLFVAGEMLGIAGRTGGFNLQLCWTTGYVAGKGC